MYRYFAATFRSTFVLACLTIFTFCTLASYTMALTVYNKGRCGQNSGGMHKLFEEDVLKLDPKPDYVFIYIGMNDVINDRFFTPLDQYIENLKWAVQQSRKAGITPIICSIHHVVEEKVYKFHSREKFEPETVNSKMDRYNAAIKKLAKELKVNLADFYAVTQKTPESNFLSNDGVHLTPSGNKLLAKTFLNAIGKQLDGKETIVCVGDSLTFGFGNVGAGSATGETYPAMLMQTPIPSPEDSEKPAK